MGSLIFSCHSCLYFKLNFNKFPKVPTNFTSYRATSFALKKHITGETSRIAGAFGRPRGDGERQRRSAADDEGAQQYEAMGKPTPKLGADYGGKKNLRICTFHFMYNKHNNNHFFSKKHVMQGLVGRPFMAEHVILGNPDSSLMFFFIYTYNPRLLPNRVRGTRRLIKGLQFKDAAAFICCCCCCWCCCCCCCCFCVWASMHKYFFWKAGAVSTWVR